MEFWIVWFAIGICFVVLFVCLILPKLMLKTHAATLPIRDRLLSRMNNENGVTLTFEPAASVRPYIRAYCIAHDGDRLYFRGEWARKIAHVKYELVVFNAANDIIDIIHVKETFNGDGVTHDTYLPKNADFVTLRLLCVDDMPFPDERRKFNLRYAIWLALLCLTLAVTVDLLLWLATTLTLRIYDDFTLTLGLPAETWAALLGYSALAAAFFPCVLSLLHFFILRRRRDSHES